MKSLKSKIQKTELRERLLAYVDTHASNGRLPSERELSAALEVNRYLLRNCLQDLMQEGLILRKPRQGMFLVSKPFARKIGLVLAAGIDSPYLDDMGQLAGICDVLQKNDAITRLINFNQLDQFPFLFRQYGLDACIWLQTSAVVIRAISEWPEPLRQRIVLTPYQSAENYEEYISGNYVARDHLGMMRMRCEYMIGREHENVILIAEESRCSRLAQKIFRDHERKLWVVDGAKSSVSELRTMLRNRDVTGIICEGMFYPLMLKALSSIPQYRPELAVENIPMFRNMAKQYPGVHVNDVFERGWNYHCEQGRRAARMALKVIETGTFQKPETVCPEFAVQPTEKPGKGEKK